MIKIVGGSDDEELVLDEDHACEPDFSANLNLSS